MPDAVDPIPFSLTVTVETPSAGDAMTRVSIFRGRAYYRVRFTVTAAVGLAPEVFLHQRLENFANPADPVLDSFSHVCGPLDMAQWTTTPDPQTGYFRKDTADILLHSVDHLPKLHDTIKRGLQFLITGLNNLQSLEETDSFTIES